MGHRLDFRFYISRTLVLVLLESELMLFSPLLSKELGAVCIQTLSSGCQVQVLAVKISRCWCVFAQLLSSQSRISNIPITCAE